MPRQQSEQAVQELNQLRQPEVTDAILSFAARPSILAAEWAVQKFGARVLADKAYDDYRANPVRDDSGRPLDVEELQGRSAMNFDYGLERADEISKDVAQDLQGAFRRVVRGYPMETATVRGLEDTYTVIGSLERAVEINPGNLDSGEHHFQDAARHILDNMISQNEGALREYLL